MQPNQDLTQETPPIVSRKILSFVVWVQIPIIVITILLYAYVATSLPGLLQKRQELLEQNRLLTEQNKSLLDENEKLAAKSQSLLQQQIERSTVVNSSGTSSLAGLKRFSGTWKNVDKGTRGLTMLAIRVAGADVWVRAWGKCHPSDCDWGEVMATAYAPSVSSDVTESAQTIAAIFKTSFNESILTIHPEAEESLRVETVTRFIDNSGRTSYTATYTLSRVP